MTENNRQNIQDNVKESAYEPQMQGRKSTSGLTLIEVLISSFLGTLLIACIYTGIIQSQQATYAASQRMAAFNLSREILEQMRGTKYSDIIPANFGTATIKLTHLGGSSRIPILCTRSTSITDASNPTRKQVTATVAWDFNGKIFKQSAYGVIYAN